MNSKDKTTNYQSEPLNACIEAARHQFSSREIAGAVDDFKRSLPPLPVTRRHTPNPVRWLAVGALVVVAALIVPTIVPTSGSGAFAQVQEWFRSYQTVHMRTIMEQGNRQVTKLDVWADYSGSVRIEVPPVTHILSAGAGLMHTLLPGERVMTQPIPMVPPAALQNAAFDWVDKLRGFQGQAWPLEESRIIDGYNATGYRLTVEEVEFTLWADEESGRPLLVLANLPGGMVMRSALEFDGELPEHAFSVPPGYQTIDPDQE